MDVHSGLTLKLARRERAYSGLRKKRTYNLFRSRQLQGRKLRTTWPEPTCFLWWLFLLELSASVVEDVPLGWTGPGQYIMSIHLQECELCQLYLECIKVSERSAPSSVQDKTWAKFKKTSYSHHGGWPAWTHLNIECLLNSRKESPGMWQVVMR